MVANESLVTNEQAVVFAILMQNGDGILTKAPHYVQEKAQMAFGTATPEMLLDENNMAIFRQWKERWTK